LLKTYCQTMWTSCDPPTLKLRKGKFGWNQIIQELVIWQQLKTDVNLICDV